MKKRALQVRLDPSMHEQVGFFAHETGTSMNRLVVDAVRAYIQQLSVEIDAEMTDTLRRVRAYSMSNEAEERDLEAFVEAEMALPDPAEGSIVSESKDGDTADQLGRILAGLG